MLVDPALLIEQAHLVALIVAVIVFATGAISAAITVMFGFRVQTAVLTGVVLAQSAEFSFLMARVGAEAGLLSQQVFSVLLLGAVVSILAAPFGYRVGLPASAWLDARLRLRRNDPPMGFVGTSLAGHAVVLGYGRVGRVVTSALREMGCDAVIVERDRALVHDLRQRHEHVIIGSASNRTILDRAGLGAASLLVVAIPDPLAIRRIVDIARAVNPAIDIVARTHSLDERDQLERRGATEAVVGELKLALEMTRHSLLRFGVGIERAESLVARLRSQDRERAREDR